MTRVTWVNGMTEVVSMTRVTGMSGMTRVTRMARVTRVTSATRVTGKGDYNSRHKSLKQTLLLLNFLENS